MCLATRKCISVKHSISALQSLVWFCKGFPVFCGLLYSSAAPPLLNLLFISMPPPSGPSVPLQLQSCWLLPLLCSPCSLARPDILEQLVLMVCKEPEEDVEDKVKFK